MHQEQAVFVVLMVGPLPSSSAPHFILLNHPSKLCQLWEDLVNSLPHSELLVWKFVNVRVLPDTGT